MVWSVSAQGALLANSVRGQKCVWDIAKIASIAKKSKMKNHSLKTKAFLAADLRG
jgi:hypothetical protein